MQISLVMVMTLNGLTAHNSNEFVDWSSKEDKKLFQKLTKKAGVVIMGRKTFDTFKRPLKDRLIYVMTRKPTQSENENIIFTNKSPHELAAEIKTKGYNTCAVTGGAQISALFLKNKLLTDLHISIEPKIFGSGIPLFADIDKDYDLKIKSFQKLNNDTLYLHYKVIF